MVVETGKGVPGRDDILGAAERIRPYAKRTPVFTSGTLNSMTGGSLHFKCENFQKAGAFKFRGACNAVYSLSGAEAVRGVATHSSGNHAQALALAAGLRGIPAYIVMPENAAPVKVAAVRGYGARIDFCPPGQQNREEALDRVVRETGACFIHPYDNPEVIAGQGTCCLELLQESGPLDLVMVPVGGGGLLAGTALGARYFGKETLVVAAEPAAADDAYRSFKSGRFVPSVDPATIADGLRTSLGKITFPIILSHVHDIVRAGEDSIAAAVKIVWERMKVVIEPSAAVPLAALLEGNLDIRGKRVGIILSGGNIDFASIRKFT